MNDTLMQRDEAYIIEVMSSFIEGHKVEFCHDRINYMPVANPCWNWEAYDYRLA